MGETRVGRDGSRWVSLCLKGNVHRAVSCFDRALFFRFSVFTVRCFPAGPEAAGAPDRRAEAGEEPLLSRGGPSIPPLPRPSPSPGLPSLPCPLPGAPHTPPQPFALSRCLTASAARGGRSGAGPAPSLSQPRVPVPSRP